MNALTEFDAAFEAEARGVDAYEMVKAFGVTVPQTLGPRCMFPHRSGWICSRVAGHGGRHVATIVGAVCAVWRADRWTAKRGRTARAVYAKVAVAAVVGAVVQAARRRARRRTS